MASVYKKYTIEILRCSSRETCIPAPAHCQRMFSYYRFSDVSCYHYNTGNAAAVIF